MDKLKARDKLLFILLETKVSDKLSYHTSVIADLWTVKRLIRAGDFDKARKLLSQIG